MRSAGQIKTELIRLRFDRKFRLPLAVIAKDSRCSPPQVISAMKLEATEVILRRLDAYLDAGDLHVHKKGTRLLYQIERLSDELYREFGARSLPMRDVQLMPTERQRRLHTAMHWRAKRLLRGVFLKETGVELRLADGLSYWKAKIKAQARKGLVASH